MAWLGAAGACTQREAEARADATPVFVASQSETMPAVYSLDERWRFEGGVVVQRLQVSPSPLVPGQPAVVRLAVSGVRGEIDMSLGLQPPRPASRQVAVGGVDAPPAVVAPDRRSTVVHTRLAVQPGMVEQTLRLTVPWHARQAVLTAALTGQGRPIRATEGPRTQTGVAMLGLVPVATAPTHVVAPRAAIPPQIDGVLDEPLWAGRATGLVLSQDGEPWHGTAGTVALAWDDASLYVAAAIPDRDIASTMTAHDDPLWKEEVFELFVFGQAPASRYLELQVSPRGVTFDAKFSAYRKGDTAWDSAWKTAVDVRGTVDDRQDTDQGWSVEVAVPWTEICAHTAAPCPPQVGQHVVINAFRFERPAKGGTVGLALSPTRVPDFHAADNAAILELGP